MQERSTYLFMTQGSSDKQYNVHLRQKEDGWIVDFENGRRGKPLRSGTKTKDPIDFETAQATFDKLVKTKKSGGYTEEESGMVFAGTEQAGDVTGFQPQLLNEVTQEEAEALGDTGHYWIQTKHDGERRGTLCTTQDFIHSNRRGLRVGVAQSVQDALEALKNSGLAEFEIDCEDMSDHLVVFDVLMFDGEDIRELPFETRANMLIALRDLTVQEGLDNIIKVDVPVKAANANDVRQAILKSRADGEEGITLKDGREPATAGRPASGGPALKLKNWDNATCRVASASGTKRSIGLELHDNGDWRKVGNCTLPGNHDFPEVGSLVEIRYLYAYKDGSLFQPTYRGPRTDLEENAASIQQLKYKRETASAA